MCPGSWQVVGCELPRLPQLPTVTTIPRFPQLPTNWPFSDVVQVNALPNDNKTPKLQETEIDTKKTYYQVKSTRRQTQNKEGKGGF